VGRRRRRLLCALPLRRRRPACTVARVPPPEPRTSTAFWCVGLGRLPASAGHQLPEERPSAAGSHLPRRIPSLQSVAATRPRRRAGVTAAVEEGAGKAGVGASEVADVVVTGGAVVGAGKADANAAVKVILAPKWVLVNNDKTHVYLIM